MNSQANISSGRKLFLISFIVGTLIFIANVMSNNDSFLLVGLLFFLLTFLLNVGLLVTLLINAYSDKINRKALLKTGLLMIINIPIAYIYMSITSALANLLIITFINTNDNLITNIQIEGCDNKILRVMQPMEKHTVWIELKNDCSLDISYDSKNGRKKENVIDYASTGMGKRITYEIGQKSDF